MAASTTDSDRPFVLTGWLLWLTWAYVALLGLGVLLQLATLALGWNPVWALFGFEASDVPKISVAWLLLQIPYIVFGIGCVGILFHDRDFAWVAVISAWVISALQCVEAVLQLFHLRLSIPLSAFIFAAYAVGMTRVLKPHRNATSMTGRGAV